jgi:hypothetical protein
MRPEIGPKLEQRIEDILEFTGAQSGPELVRQATREKVREIEQHQIEMDEFKTTGSETTLPTEVPPVCKTDNPALTIGYSDDSMASPVNLSRENPRAFVRVENITEDGTNPIINDVLETHERIDGPTLFIDEEGIDLNYLRAHLAKFGKEDIAENVLYFSVPHTIPETIPGLSVFDLRPFLEQGTDRQAAVDYKIELFRNLCHIDFKGDIPHAITVLENLLGILYDEQYAQKMVENDTQHELVDDRIPERESVDTFSVQHLKELLTHLARRIDSSDIHECLSISESSDLPEVQNLEPMFSEDNVGHTLISAAQHIVGRFTEDPILNEVMNNQQSLFNLRNLLVDNNLLIIGLEGCHLSQYFTNLLMHQIIDVKGGYGASSLEENVTFAFNKTSPQITDLESEALRYRIENMFSVVHMPPSHEGLFTLLKQSHLEQELRMKKLYSVL